jgi:hypothetical protein
LLLGGGASVLFAGCGAAENLFDCQNVCTRFRDCFDSTYDVGQCRDTCRANSEKDPSTQQKADSCESCIGDKSCAESAVTCSVACMGIVP